MVVTPARDNADGDKIAKSKLALAKALALFSKLKYVAKTWWHSHSPVYKEAMKAINAMFAQVDVYKSSQHAMSWNDGNVQKMFADIGPHVVKLLATAEFSANKSR
jgi:hypothetical protein